jgi:hypothetical protein
MNSALAWADAERITCGQIARTIRSTCPFCSHTRRHHNQSKKVFAIRLKEPDFAVYNCVHCGESGYVHPDASSRVIDLAELRRRQQENERRERDDKQRRTSSATRIWNEAEPFFGSPAETYLRDTRQIGDWLYAFVRIDESLRFHPKCPFDGNLSPCMVALVRNIETNEPQAIHRTALRLGARPERIGRLSLGPIAGGAIKLSPDDEVTHGLLVAEGIETALSAAVRFKFQPVWSVLSRAGIAKFPALPGIECVTIAVDNDDSGDGQRDAQTLVERLTSVGVEVITAQTNLAKDFNDAARAQ